MRLIVAVVGKPRNAGLAAAIVDYEKRAARYWPLDVHEVREERAAGIDHELVREREGDRLLERAAGRILACNPGGKSFTSEAFAQYLRGGCGSRRVDPHRRRLRAVGHRLVPILDDTFARAMDSASRAGAPRPRGAAVSCGVHHSRGALPQVTDGA